MSDCERYEEMISALLDGELSAAEEAEVRAHMASCPDCAAMYEAFAAVGAAVGAQNVPDTLHDGIMAKVRAAESASRTQHKIIRLRPILTAAACLIVLVGTVFALRNNIGFGRSAAKNTEDAPMSVEQFSAGGAFDAAEAPAAEPYGDKGMDGVAESMKSDAAVSDDGVKSGSNAISMLTPSAAAAASGESADASFTVRLEALTEDGFTGVVIQEKAMPLAQSETVTVIWEGEEKLTPGMLLIVTYNPENRSDDGRILADSVEPSQTEP